MSKRGLPTDRQMRHDAHYIDELVGTRSTAIGRLIPITAIEPNPLQPRVEIGELDELTASISDKGVLEPLLVQPRGNNQWLIIAGERRWRAATAAGLQEVPCIELDVDDGTVAEIALIENLQRKDLTIWEEAEGLLSLSQRFGYTHEEVARKVGKSRSSITEAMTIALLPPEVKEKCRTAKVHAKSTLLQIARQPNDEEMAKIVDLITRRSLTRDEARSARRVLNGETQYARPKLKIYKYEVSGAIKVQIEAHTELSAVEIVSALEHAKRQVLNFDGFESDKGKMGTYQT